MGPLPTTPAQKKLLLVAIDYFNKWIEADAFALILIKMLLGSSGKTLSVGSASRDQSYPIMGRSLTAGFTGTFSRN